MHTCISRLLYNCHNAICATQPIPINPKRENALWGKRQGRSKGGPRVTHMFVDGELDFAIYNLENLRPIVPVTVRRTSTRYISRAGKPNYRRPPVLTVCHQHVAAGSKTPAASANRLGEGARSPAQKARRAEARGALQLCAAQM